MTLKFSVGGIFGLLVTGATFFPFIRLLGDYFRGLEMTLAGWLWGAFLTSAFVLGLACFIEATPDEVTIGDEPS